MKWPWRNYVRTNLFPPNTTHDKATDPASAHALLRGTVHECDRILRGRAAAEKGDDDLSPKFYLTYGSAIHDLLMLDALAEGEESADYLELARDMLEKGYRLAKGVDDESSLSEIALAVGKVLLGMVSRGN